MNKVFVALTVVVLGTCGFIFASGSSDTTNDAQTPEQAEQAATQKAAAAVTAHQAQRAAWATRDEEGAKALESLGPRVTAFSSRSPNGDAWKTEALAIAEVMASMPKSDALDAIKKHWRSISAVQNVAAAEFRNKAAIVNRALPALLEDGERAYAARVDRGLIDAGIEAEATMRRGPKGAVLQVRSALVGRVFADQLANKGGILDGAAKVGFVELVFKNSIDASTLTYALSSISSASLGALKAEVERRWGLAG